MKIQQYILLLLRIFLDPIYKKYFSHFFYREVIHFGDDEVWHARSKRKQYSNDDIGNYVKISFHPMLTKNELRRPTLGLGPIFLYRLY